MTQVGDRSLSAIRGLVPVRSLKEVDSQGPTFDSGFASGSAFMGHPFFGET